MINKLIKHFGDSLIITEEPIQGDNYHWYVSDDGVVFGIKKNKVTLEEENLLSTLFNRYNKQKPSMTEDQAAWYQYLLHGKNTVSHLFTTFSYCRFIHFKTSKVISDKEDFEVAVNALFPSKVIVLWLDEATGTIIETSTGDKSDQIIMDEMIDTLTSDFYVDIYFLVGQTYSFDHDIKEDFNWERLCFGRATYYFHKQKVIRLYDIIPYMLLEKIDPFFTKKLTDSILQDLKNDKELLETIKVFLESNLNVSYAAKKLYMHRNSLQYRIDKFIEKTGIDIKHFQGALTTYLAILNTEHFLPNE